MEGNMVFIWGGALLVVAGVVYGAWQAMDRGRLSDASPVRPGVGTDTLEPRGRSKGFGIKDHWPALALIAVGSLLLLAGVAL
jgi:hypothetical protein